jgi:hypothetical protein
MTFELDLLKPGNLQRRLSRADGISASKGRARPVCGGTSAVSPSNLTAETQQGNTIMKSADAEMKERKSLVGSTGSMTYHSRAATALELEGQGRHAAAAKAQLTGREAFVKYPRQSPTLPWSSDLSGVEPPLGIDLEYVEPCGTPVEVAVSMLASGADEAVATAEAASTSAGASGVVDVLSSVDDALAPSALVPLAVGGVSLLRGRRL